MTSILLKDVSKRYGYQWIVKDFEAQFNVDTICGIAGANGSGKSTLIKMMSGFLTPSQGEIQYLLDSKNVQNIELYTYISLVGPYTDLINEFTLSEMLIFHQKFKAFHNYVTYEEFETMIELSGQRDKLLSHFSSGMKQKIQLALALLSTTPYLLMDEPTSFLDQNAKLWFANQLAKYAKDRVVVIASNDTYDLNLCTHTKTLGV